MECLFFGLPDQANQASRHLSVAKLSTRKLTCWCAGLASPAR